MLTIANKNIPHVDTNLQFYSTHCSFIVINMNTNEQQSQITINDASLLVKLIVELAIAKRTVTTYPAGHPLVEESLNKVINSYHDFLEKNHEIQLGIAKDTILLDGVPLETSQKVVHSFARALFDHGIAILIMHQGLTSRELQDFINILGLKREQINQHGGIDEIWKQAGISSLNIISLNYNVIGMKDHSINNESNPATGIWEIMTRELLSGKSYSNSDQSFDELDPEILAEILNSNLETPDITGSTTQLKNSIKSFINKSVIGTAARNGSLPLEKIAAFVSKLHPALRQQFLESSHSILDNRGKPVAEAILTSMPGEALLETFEDFSNNQQQVSPVIMSLIAKLAGHSEQSSITTKLGEDELHSKMRLILLEHPSEEFVPDDYQQKLNFIIAENQLQQIRLADREELLQTVNQVQVDVNINEIVIQLLSEGCESPEERDVLIQNLGEMFEYCLQTGDYSKVLHQLENLKNELLPAAIRAHLREYYCRRDFLDEIINGLKTWGKPRYQDIHAMISIIGLPFIDPLLDALATEDSLSLRRFLIDRLIEFGPATRSSIAKRLDDERWFVLRNLIVILKAYKDPSVIPMLRPLSRHQNPKVRQEALSALIAQHDQAAEHQLAHDLDSKDYQILISAIHLAEKSCSVEIGKKLLQQLTKLGWTNEEVDIKITIIHALGEQHISDSIPELAKILGSSSFFHGKALQRVKLEIIKSLENYSSSIVLPILERLCDENNQCGVQAQKSLQAVKIRDNKK